MRHQKKDRYVVKATFNMLLNKSFAMLTSFLRVRQNLPSEFVLDVKNLEEKSTTFRNSIKIVWNFLLNEYSAQ